MNLVTYNERTKKATRKYLQSVDRIGLTMKSGRKAIIKEAADRKGISVNEFCIRAIENALPSDLKEPTLENQ